MKHWLETWQGILASIVAAVGSAIALLKLVPKVYFVARQLYESVSFLLHIERLLQEFRLQVMNALARLDDGQLNILQTRRLVMDADQRLVFFETDPHGKWTWANRLWSEYSGLTHDETRGSGWENGIAMADRSRVIQGWQLAIDHQRIYEDTFSCEDRHGNKTRIRVSASPIRAHDGRLLNWHGHGMKVE